MYWKACLYLAAWAMITYSDPAAQEGGDGKVLPEVLDSEDEDEEITQDDKSSPSFAPPKKFAGDRVAAFEWRFDGQSGYIYITALEIFESMAAELKGQLHLLARDKELYGIFKKCFRSILRRKKVQVLVELMSKPDGEKPKFPNRAAVYSAATRRAELGALVRLFTDSIKVTQDEIDAARAQLSSQLRSGFTGFYVMLNKQHQAEDVIQRVRMNLDKQKSAIDTFTEAAAQYALVKPLGDRGYPANEYYIGSVFGNDALSAISSTTEGRCNSEPIKLKDNKWLVVYLQEKVRIPLTHEYTVNYATSKKINEIVDEYKDDMLRKKQILILINDFHQAIGSEDNMDKVAAKVGDYSITIADLYRLLESILPNKNIREMIFSYPSPNKKQAVNYFFNTALDLSIAFHIKAIIAKEHGLDKSNKDLYNEYLRTAQGAEVEGFLQKYIRESIQEQELREIYFQRSQSMPKTKVKGMFILVELKKIAEKLLSNLSAFETEKTKNLYHQRTIEQVFAERAGEYSVAPDGNISFDERIGDIKKVFGELKHSFSDDAAVSEIKPGSFYVCANRERGFYLIYVSEVYDQDIGYDELVHVISGELVKKSIEEYLAKMSCTRSKNK